MDVNENEKELDLGKNVPRGVYKICIVYLIVIFFAFKENILKLDNFSNSKAQLGLVFASRPEKYRKGAYENLTLIVPRFQMKAEQHLPERAAPPTFSCD